MVINDTPFGVFHVASWYEYHMCIKKAVRGLLLLIVYCGVLVASRSDKTEWPWSMPKE